MFKNKSGLIFLSLVIFSVGCSTQITTPGERLFVKADRIPTVKLVQSLKGRSLSEVEKSIGPPADTSPQGRRFWFLSDETDYHPSPTPRLYELLFDSQGRLSDIRLGVSK